MARLPTVGSDTGTWGTVLNDYLTTTAETAALSASPSQVATSVTLALVPKGVVVGTTIAIDAFTSECEVREITSIAGSTVSFTRPLIFSHASGDIVQIVYDTLPAIMFNITGAIADQWVKVQRWVNEGWWHGKTLTGINSDYYIYQPVIFPNGTRVNQVRFNSGTTFAPADVTSAMIIVANCGVSPVPFTATASNNTFTITTDVGHNVGNQIVFNAPYGETLPGGLVPGRVYWIKTEPTSLTFTVSETDGGTELDLTSDGAGTLYSRISSGSRIYAETLRLTVRTVNVNGLRAFIQQPSYTRNLRIEMVAAATAHGNATGFLLSGQLSYHDNVEIDTWTNCIGLSCAGTGMVFKGFTCNGVADGDTAIVISGSRHAFNDIWTEQLGRAEVEISPEGAVNVRGISIVGSWLVSGPITTPCLLVNGPCSYQVLACLRPPSTSYVLLQDNYRNVTILAWDGLTPGVGETDTSLTYFGHRQAWAGELTLNYRMSPSTITTNATLRRMWDLTRVDTTAASRTITVPTAVGWAGWYTTVVNWTGANSVIIDPTGSETIAGNATLTLTAGQAVTIASDGVNYRVIGRN